MKSLNHEAWLRLLEVVFELKFSDKLDFIDISYEDLDVALEKLSEREVLALKLRFEDGLTFQKVGENLPRMDIIPKRERAKRKSVGVSRDRAMNIVKLAIRKLRSPPKREKLKSCFAGISLT